MSVEALWLVALFIGLPLIEQVITRARRRRAVVAAEAKRGDVQQTALDRPPDAVPPQPPIPRPVARLAASLQPSRTAFRARRDRLRRIGEVREAMAMRVILGPCRALDARGDEPPP